MQRMPDEKSVVWFLDLIEINICFLVLIRWDLWEIRYISNDDALYFFQSSTVFYTKGYGLAAYHDAHNFIISLRVLFLRKYGPLYVEALQRPTKFAYYNLRYS